MQDTEKKFVGGVKKGTNSTRERNLTPEWFAFRRSALNVALRA